MKTFTDSNFDNLLTLGPHAMTGYIMLPLGLWREGNSNDIPAISDSPLTDDPAGFGGLLATNTTPTLEFTNGDTDSALRMLWSTANDQDVVVVQTSLPPDLDPSNNLELHIVGSMSGATDTPTHDFDTYFNTGDTKVEDTVQFDQGTTVTEYIVTIAAADIPNTAYTVTIECTPGAHTTDTMSWFATWLEYTRLP